MELQRCEPRVVSLLEAADWLRQANEKTGIAVTNTTVYGQTIADSHARLSHLRTRLAVLTNMTANYTSKLGMVLGYDISPENDCIRLHQVKNKFNFEIIQVLNRSLMKNNLNHIHVTNFYLILFRISIIICLHCDHY